MRHNGRIANRLKKNAAVLLVIGFAMVGLAFTAAAQTDRLADWSPPVNLSRSGSATDPVVVVDSGGQVHVLWQDAFDGFAYASGDGVTWETRVPAELPFYTRSYSPNLRDTEPTPRFVPQLVADAYGDIHAFWQDAEEIFYGSWVAADEVLDFDEWDYPQELSASVAASYATVDTDGGLHLVYVQTSQSEESPAGVYYRRWNSRGLYWYDPVPLQESVYLRLLEPGEARVALAADGSGRLVAAWDDPRTGLMLGSRSINGGISWTDPEAIVVEVSGETLETAADEEASVQLALIDLVADDGGMMHLVWRAEGGDACVTYHQTSDDGGESWAEALPVPLDGCELVREVVQGDAGQLYLLATGETDDILLAWDGERWSEPLALPAEFDDPETGRPVALGCAQVAVWDEGRLLVVGCDQAGGRDIWMLTQAEGESAGELFIAPTPMATPAWGTLAEVLLRIDEENPVDARHPAIAGDVTVEGRFHIVWSQPAEEDPDGLGRTIYYARWDALDTEHYPRAVALFGSEEEKAEQPSLAADAAGRLHLVWSGDMVGEIRYSRAVADAAFNPTNWAEPRRLPMVQPSGSWPVIAVDPYDVIHVVYVVPLNEGRGVYHTCSTDGGDSWREPATIADGAKAGWAMVDHPTMAVAGDGTMQVAWSALPLPGSLMPGAIYTAHSSGCGSRWSEPFQAAEGAVDWPQLAAAGALEVHLVYIEETGRVPYQHRWSLDGGQNWSRSNWISGLEVGVGPVRMVVDGAGRVHMMALTSTEGDVGTPLSAVRELMWDGAHWVEVGDGAVTLEGYSAHASAVAAGTGDRLGLALAGSRWEENEGGEAVAVRLVALLNRTVAMPEVMPTPLPTLTPTATPRPQPTATPAPEPTPTPDLSGAADAQVKVGPFSLPGDWAGLVAGAVPAAVVVLLIFAVAAVAVRAGRR